MSLNKKGCSLWEQPFLIMVRRRNRAARLQRNLEDALLDAALAEHRRVAILREENRELSLANRVKALRNIGKELDILLLVELGLGLKAILLLAPAKNLIGTREQELNVDILAVQLQTGLARITQIQLLNHHKDIIAIDVVAAQRQRSHIVIVDKIEYGLKTRMQRRVLRFVF